MLSLLRKSTKALRLASQILASPTQRRHFWRWVGSGRRHFLVRNATPWITYDAIDFLASRARPGMHVFEYGSGGSTLFWVKLGAQITSIEHFRVWYNILEPRLRSNPNADYRLIEAEPYTDPRGDAADPALYLSREDDYKKHIFKNYVTQIDAFPDAHFDVVVVDGRARPSCITNALPKIKPGGLLVLDNAERDYYLTHAPAELATWQRHRFEGIGPRARWFWETSVWTKPA